MIERVARARLQEMSETEPRSEGICLTTESSANVRLYMRYGYAVIGEAEVDEIHTRCMFRPDTCQTALLG